MTDALEAGGGGKTFLGYVNQSENIFFCFKIYYLYFVKYNNTMCCAILICNYYVSVQSSQFFLAFTHKKIYIKNYGLKD